MVILITVLSIVFFIDNMIMIMAWSPALYSSQSSLHHQDPPHHHPNHNLDLTQGRDLLHTLGVETDGLEPPLTALPWILFNNVNIFPMIMTMMICQNHQINHNKKLTKDVHCVQEYSAENMPGALNDLVSSFFFCKT